MDIKKKIKNLPDTPGVYLMKDKDGQIIYVGKAASIKKRAASYFRQRPLSARLAALTGSIKDIDFIITANEAEALLLESALIKSRQPRYNVALRDDKNYPLLKLTLNEKFPRLLITRMKKSDGARYFGPFTEAKLLRQALAFLRRAFPLRTCKTMPKTVCLNFYLRQCLAPCVGKADAEKYKEISEQLIMFLEGRRPELLRQLEEKMIKASKENRFEEAARLRDQIRALTVAIVPNGSAGLKNLSYPEEMEALKEILNLKKIPNRVEAFDVSNISGKEAVGSMVTFLNGAPYKNGYRKFKIKTVVGIDDYSMIREVVERRYRNLIEEKETPPDLIIIDGGKGHLSSTKEELDNLGLRDIPIMAIAKEFEHIFVPERQGPIRLPATSPILFLIQRIRDEAHRFAVSYHKVLRQRLTSMSELDNIKGVGPKKKTDLFKHFGSMEGIKKATKTDLLQIKGINKDLAEKIQHALRK